MGALYSGLRVLLKAALELYYVDIQTVGAEKVPTEGPVMFAANHPNSIMDTVVLGASTQRTVSYMARSGLFDNFVVAAIFNRCGVIPVYRRQDGPSQPDGNQDAFRAAYEVLEEAGTIGIFPEGRNAPERHVRDIKTGTARIALGAEAQNDFSLGVKVVPVGLNFEDRDKFLSRVLVRFGDPIDARDFAAAYAEDERGAARAMTDAIQAGIRDAAVHVHDLRYERLVEDIYQVYGKQLIEDRLGALPDVRALTDQLIDRAAGRYEDHEDLDASFTAKQWIADAIAHYEQHDSETLTRIEGRMRRYKENLAQAKLRADFTDRPPKTVSARREAIKLTLYTLLLWPVAYWGFIHNVVPYWLTRKLAFRAPDEAMRAIGLLAYGSVFFGLAYFLFGWSAYASTGSHWSAATHVATLPIAGFWFLRFRRQLARYRDRILARTLFRNKRRLLRSLVLEREQLLMEFDEVQREYGSVTEARAGRSSAD